jgi:hypothetical protein
MSPWNPAMCCTKEAAEAYRQYQLAYRVQRDHRAGQSAPFHFPYDHRTVAEWDR